MVEQGPYKAEVDGPNPSVRTLHHFIPQGKQVYSEQSEKGAWRSG